MLPEELCEEAEIYGKECAIKRMKKIPGLDEHLYNMANILVVIVFG